MNPTTTAAKRVLQTAIQPVVEPERLRNFENELSRQVTLQERADKLQDRLARGKGGATENELMQIKKVMEGDEKRLARPNSEFAEVLRQVKTKLSALGSPIATDKAVKVLFTGSPVSLSKDDLSTISGALESHKTDFAAAAAVAMSHLASFPDRGAAGVTSFIESPDGTFDKRVEIVKKIASANEVTEAAPGAAAKPDYSDFSHWNPTDVNNLAPCPFTNSLANHGFLPREGMTQEEISDALTGALKCDSLIARVFASSGVNLGKSQDAQGRKVVSLSELDVHGGIEHDASLTREDFKVGDSVHFSPELYEQLRAYAKDGYISKGDLARFRRDRENDSRARNPEFDFSIKRQFTAYGEAALLYKSMSDESGKGMRVDWLDTLFKEERFPTELGWTPRPINTVGVLALALELRAKVATGFF